MTEPTPDTTAAQVPQVPTDLANSPNLNELIQAAVAQAIAQERDRVAKENAPRELTPREQAQASITRLLALGDGDHTAQLHHYQVAEITRLLSQLVDKVYPADESEASS